MKLNWEKAVYQPPFLLANIYPATKFFFKPRRTLTEHSFVCGLIRILNDLPQAIYSSLKMAHPLD